MEFQGRPTEVQIRTKTDVRTKNGNSRNEDDATQLTSFSFCVKKFRISLYETMNLFTRVGLDTEEEIGVFLSVAFFREIREPAAKGFHAGADVFGGAVLRANRTGNSV